MIVDVTPRAELDLIEAVAWYEEREAGVGRRFYDAVVSALADLPKARLRKVPRSQSGALFVEVGRPWPYRIVVRKRGDVLEVVALAHHRRADDYWVR